ncbi:MAG TPA: response regulator [Cyclobacteriaceae bacterium]|nr:response regulator [Cyclobacteriaceae bacterium]
MSTNNYNLLAEDLKEVDFESTEVYQILFLEDNADDVELMEHELNESGLQFASRRVDSKEKFIKEVFEFRPDIILADYSLTSFNGMEAFRKLKGENLSIPFILVTGVLSEKLALDCLKEGVDDFILKSSFKRLPAAVISAIRKKEMQDEKKRIASELKKSHEELRLLVNRHQISIEEERTNIARDLHDELGQVLTALKIDIAMLRKKLTSGKKMSEEAIHEEFAAVAKTIDKIAQSTKEISAGLRPVTLDELGILDAIQWQATEFEKRNQITCQLFLSTDHLDISKELSIALFRIVQEALTNVARHSLATAVQIYLDSLDNVLFLEILDNGKGIEDEQIKSSKSLGIIGLRERVQLLHGHFFIGKAKGGGTKVSIMIPTKQN